MPTILRYRGLRIMIYLNDHAPPHVHVVGADAHAKFDLLCDLGQVQFKEGYGFTMKQINDIGQFLTHHIKALCAAWSQYHGL
jgi:hypothetical protein